MVFYQGQEPLGLYCIANGDVLLERTDSHGNETAFRIAGPGEMIGYRSLFGRHAHEATARALSPVRLCFFPAPVVEEFVASSPRLAREFLALVARDPGPIHAPLLRNPLASAISRLAQLILILVQRRAQQTGPKEFVLKLPVSNADIASLIGIRRETVTRRLQELERDGICSHKGRQLVITDIDRLVALASDDVRAIDANREATPGPAAARNRRAP